MGFWSALLAVIAASSAALTAVGRRRRMPIVALVPMVLAHAVGTAVLLAGLIEWFFDPLAAVGEYGDEGGAEFVLVAPLVLVGSALLSAAWIPALRKRQ
jgi:hypothetical protein